MNVPWSRKGDVRCPSCQGQTLRELVGRYQLAVVATAGRREQGDTCGCACGAEGAGACCQLPDV